jgi:trehalose/maltose hydrolase-like predicted phosphorylase
MAGTLDLVQRGYTGLVVERDVLRFEPALPDGVERLDLRLYYRGHHLEVGLDHSYLRVGAPVSHLAPVRIACDGQVAELRGGETLTFELASLPD